VHRGNHPNPDKKSKKSERNVKVGRKRRTYKSTLSSSMPDSAGRELAENAHHFSLGLS